MTRKRPIRPLALLAGLAAVAPVAAAAPGCRMATADTAWLNGALAHWRVAERDLLELMPRPWPAIIVADARCTYASHPAAHDRLIWAGRPHGPTVTFPDGKSQPLGPISFSSGGGKVTYFAMSLPSVWRAAAVKSGLGLERLMDGVMLHEFMHLRQSYFATSMLAAAARAYGPGGDEIGDDTLQDRFKSDPAYVAAYEAERDALFAAAAAPGEAEARQLARRALALLRARRARFFSGAAAKWRPFDDIFLDMEGIGQWLAYAWYVSPRGPQLPRDTVLGEVRRGGKYWTQDEGLALMLTVDRLVPGWQKLAFAEKPLLAEALLAKAAGE